MEVHHHAHDPAAPHDKKNWKSYFWEFLMLFLAVFCGFLAEYQLEHVIENQREKQYMITMLEDLKSDTTLLNYSVKYWDDINNSVDSVADAIQFPPSEGDLIKIYRHLTNATNYFSFKYNDRTVAQLKNAGGFRLIRNKTVANKIILYDQYNNDATLNIHNQHNFFFETLIQLRNKVFSQDIQNKIYERYLYKIPPPSENLWIDSLLKKNKIPLPTENYSSLLFEFKNALLAYRKDYTNMNWCYKTLQENINELIILIEKEYHL